MKEDLTVKAWRQLANETRCDKSAATLLLMEMLVQCQRENQELMKRLVVSVETFTKWASQPAEKETSTLNKV